jgi:predicted esterase
VSTPRSRLAPLAANWLEALELDDEKLGPASVSVPVGATEPRPVVVALHGHGDRPEWACGEWRGVTHAHPFVLCPHGVPARAPKGRGLSFGSIAQTTREIDLGIQALERRFPGYVARGPLVLVGFSLGAIQGSPIVSAAPQRFPLAMLAEGGVAHWTPERLRAFREAGGRRLVFACRT